MLIYLFFFKLWLLVKIEIRLFRFATLCFLALRGRMHLRLKWRFIKTITEVQAVIVRIVILWLIVGIIIDIIAVADVEENMSLVRIYGILVLIILINHPCVLTHFFCF